MSTQLNDAYRLDVQQKQSLKKLTRYFLKPDLIFRGSDNFILKIASLFLNKDFVYSDNHITNYLKDEVWIVYGAQYSNRKENFEEAEIIKNINKEQQELITSIIKIELDKGNKISTPNAIKVMSFLLKLAKTCISIKMEVS